LDLDVGGTHLQFPAIVLDSDPHAPSILSRALGVAEGKPERWQIKTIDTGRFANFR
jgi:hypothetical protein